MKRIVPLFEEFLGKTKSEQVNEAVNWTAESGVFVAVSGKSTNDQDPEELFLAMNIKPEDIEGEELMFFVNKFKEANIDPFDYMTYEDNNKLKLGDISIENQAIEQYGDDFIEITPESVAQAIEKANQDPIIPVLQSMGFETKICAGVFMEYN